MTIPLPTAQELRPDLDWQDIVSIIGMSQALAILVVLRLADDTLHCSKIAASCGDSFDVLRTSHDIVLI
jgi:hypothetical protein